MAKQLQLRRGTTTQHSSFTGLDGEVTVDTTKKTVVVHDGSTAGGEVLATEGYVDAQTHLSLIDEDNMTTNSATRPPSQQSVKAYVDTTVAATNELVEDSSPQLGGDLDLNNNDITGTGGIPAGNLTGTIADARMPDLTGEVTTSAGTVSTAIASNVVDEDNLKISNAGTNGQFLSKQSGNTGGLTWATVASPSSGISDGDFLEANANVADNDFLRVDGTEIEGRTAAETLSDIGGAASGANSDITSITGLTTDLAVAHGGTGAGTHTANSVLVGEGTSAISSVAPSTSGNVLTSNGTVWQSTAPGGGYMSSTFLDQGALFSRASANTLAVPDLGGVVDGDLVEVAATSLSLNTSGNWDGNGSFHTQSNRAGKDFYLYLKKAGGVVLSNNASVPNGFTSSNTRKLAGFHTLCVAVGSISGHTLSGLALGDILPASVYDRYNKPVASPEGMVKDINGLWWDIYLPSESGGNLVSVYNGSIVHGENNPDHHYYNFIERFAKLNKRIPFQVEFMSASEGSNLETIYNGGDYPANTGGHYDTSSRRMISNIGCEDMCGAYYQWAQDTSADDFTSGYWTASDNSGDSGTYDNSNGLNRGFYKEPPDRGMVGGSEGGGTVGGPRSIRFDIATINRDESGSARACCESSGSGRF